MRGVRLTQLVRKHAGVLIGVTLRPRASDVMMTGANGGGVAHISRKIPAPCPGYLRTYATETQVHLRIYWSALQRFCRQRAIEHTA